MIKKEKTKRSEFRSLTPKQKARFIWDYYKLPIAIGLIVLYMIVWQIIRAGTKKEIFLYGALINVAVEKDLETTLSTVPAAAFEQNAGESGAAKKQKSPGIIQLSTGWYLTEHPDGDSFSYTQASQMKILASIDAQQLDFIIMDKEAFDAFAQNGFLLDLSTVDFGDLQQLISGYFTENMEIVEDNAKEIALDPSIPYQSTTKTYPMGIDLSACPPIEQARFSEPVYLGMISNSPRCDHIISYVTSLWERQ